MRGQIFCILIAQASDERLHGDLGTSAVTECLDLLSKVNVLLAGEIRPHGIQTHTLKTVARSTDRSLGGTGSCISSRPRPRGSEGNQNNQRRKQFTHSNLHFFYKYKTNP